MNLLRASDNRFVAVNDDGSKAGTASISRFVQERIFENRPVQFEINVRASEEAKTLLYSAAATRARVLAEKETKPSRVYAVVEPDDSSALEALRLMGFRNMDGIVRTRKPIHVKGYCERLPEEFTPVNDYLNNPREFRACLTRYNDCFGRNEPASWLTDIMNEPDFVRLMIVSEEGLCGELLAWSRGDTGVIGVIQTARRYRRMGIASNLIETARLYFEKKGMSYLSFDVWRAAPGCKALAQSAGFTDYKIIQLFPEII